MSSSGRDQASSAIWVAVSQVELPEKKYFKIGEVAHLVGVEPHVLRYWQTQFTQVRPHKSRSGHRLYRRKDVETLLAIKELLHVQRFTIAGARQALRNAVVHRGDTTRPPMEVDAVEPAGAQQVAPQQAELELVGLEPSALKGAMDKELAARTGATERVDVAPGELEQAPTAPPQSTAAEVSPRGPAVAESSADPTLPPEAAGLEAVSGPSTAVDEAPLEGEAPAVAAAASPAAAVASVAAPGHSKADDVAGRLNFPLIGADRQALQLARREVLGLLAVLEREHANDRRQMLFPGAVPPAST